jgi:hypothetical protein
MVLSSHSNDSSAFAMKNKLEVRDRDFICDLGISQDSRQLYKLLIEADASIIVILRPIPLQRTKDRQVSYAIQQPTEIESMVSKMAYDRYGQRETLHIGTVRHQMLRDRWKVLHALDRHFMKRDTAVLQYNIVGL